MSTSSRPFTLNPTLFNQALYSRLLTLWFSDFPPTAKNPTPAHLSRWFGRGASADAKREFDAQCAAIALPALESIAADKFVLPELQEDGRDHGRIARPFLGEFGATDPSARAEDDGNNGNEVKEFSDARNALALILLLDQMPRNIFRARQSIIYTHYDRIARAVAYSVFGCGLDGSRVVRASPPWRVWFYMPLMHSESLGDHEVLAGKLRGMRGDVEEEVRRSKEERGEGGEGEGGDKEDEMGYLKNMELFEGKHRGILEKFGRYPHRNRELGREFRGEEREWLEGGGDTFGTS